MNVKPPPQGIGLSFCGKSVRICVPAFFIASGKGIKSGIVLENGKLINHGPTIAKILGIDLKDADGMAEEKILDI